MHTMRALLLGSLVCLVVAGNAAADGILIQSTTSTQNSGLFDHLLPRFTAATGIKVRVVAVGTGQALRNAAGGDADIVMVHARSAEEKFVRDGFGLRRHPVMYNDFVLLGPATDPAGVTGSPDVGTAFERIATAQAKFVTRGDDSGTHKRELALWQAAGIDVDPAVQRWYTDVGAGMGRALSIAVELDAYILSDRGTWISFARRGEHKIVHEGDAGLHNQYSVILVNPERHPHVNAGDGQAFIDWITGPDGQAAIAEFRLGGKQLFYPNAGSDT
ncbi:MAG: substrate-binding domain-containing protein [Gammaproteobacteria bacterium]